MTGVVGHSRESGNLPVARKTPAFAGVTFACALLATAAHAADATPVVLVSPAPVDDLVAFETLVGGEEIETATDFGLVQPSGDGYAIRAVRTRVTDAGLRVAPCEGGLAPTPLPDLYEGAYACEGEVPVPISYQPGKDKLLPNLLDPNGIWEEEGFFVSTLMSIKITPADAVTLPEESVRPLFEDAPETLDGLIGRPAPPHVQASGPCGADGVALYFPMAALPACADADSLK